MRFIPNKFEDVKFFELKEYSDLRGTFKEVFNKKIKLAIGENIEFIQDNESYSEYGVLRGLHYQKPPFEQSKLLRVVYGRIQDVIVDLRKKSNTYGEWETFDIDHVNNRVLFIPKGFAHGFLVLSKMAIVNYKVDNFYKPESESGIKYNDPNLNIKWKLDSSEISIIDKDLNYPEMKVLR